MFLLRRVSQPALALGCKDPNFKHNQNVAIYFFISVLQQMFSVQYLTAMHTS